MIKRPPKLIHSFGSLIRNKAWPKQEFKIRIVEYTNTDSILLDIREFVTVDKEIATEVFRTGYRRKGIALNLEQAEHLQELLPSIIMKLKEVFCDKDISRQVKEVKT